MADAKYTMFRNFMANELGITKEDIKEWTMQAIAQRVEKLIGQVNVDEVVAKSIKKELTYSQVNEIGKRAIHDEVVRAFEQDYKIKVVQRKE